MHMTIDITDIMSSHKKLWRNRLSSHKKKRQKIFHLL